MHCNTETEKLSRTLQSYNNLSILSLYTQYMHYREFTVSAVYQSYIYSVSHIPTALIFYSIPAG